jgi:acetoin:2,6-dichlorophenolindophenol oxidoreductase subunit alpha
LSAPAAAVRAEAPEPDQRAALLELYRRVLLIRCAEERLSAMFADGEVPGFIHLSIGQEAVSVGVLDALTAEDTIALTHRGHGPATRRSSTSSGSGTRRPCSASPRSRRR